MSTAFQIQHHEPPLFVLPRLQSLSQQTPPVATTGDSDSQILSQVVVINMSPLLHFRRHCNLLQIQKLPGSEWCQTCSVWCLQRCQQNCIVGWRRLDRIELAYICQVSSSSSSSSRDCHQHCGVETFGSYRAGLHLPGG